MESIKREDFLAFAKEIGYQVSVLEHNFYSLSLTTDKALERSWTISEKGFDVGGLFFLSKVLENVDSWEKCYLFKKVPSWKPFGSKDASEDVWVHLLRKMGIPDEFEGALGYERSELVDTLSLLCVHTFFIWSGADEYYVIFDHAKQLLYVDEDLDMHVEFVDKKRLDQFVADLARLDYPAKSIETNKRK